MLTALEWNHASVLALGAVKLENNLLSSLGLLPEDRLGLSSEPLLLHVVTALPLSLGRVLAFLVLCNLVESIPPALLSSTVGVTRFGDVYHFVIKWSGNNILTTCLGQNEKYLKSLLWKRTSARPCPGRFY